MPGAWKWCWNEQVPALRLAVARQECLHLLGALDRRVQVHRLGGRVQVELGHERLELAHGRGRGHRRRPRCRRSLFVLDEIADGRIDQAEDELVRPLVTLHNIRMARAEQAILNKALPSVAAESAVAGRAPEAEAISSWEAVSARTSMDTIPGR
jgi:hypothetical protein